MLRRHKLAVTSLAVRLSDLIGGSRSMRIYSFKFRFNRFSRTSLLHAVRLADLLLIRPHRVAAERQPRTEARHRQQDHGSEGLTNWGP
jgi:hypothetical protein